MAVTSRSGGDRTLSAGADQITPRPRHVRLSSSGTSGNGLRRIRTTASFARIVWSAWTWTLSWPRAASHHSWKGGRPSKTSLAWRGTAPCQQQERRHRRQRGRTTTMDMHLKAADGLDAAAWLRSQSKYKKVPIVAISGSGTDRLNSAVAMGRIFADVKTVRREKNFLK